MFYDIINDYIERTFTDEHVKHTALVMFNFMHKELNYRSCYDIQRAIRVINIVHDVIAVNVNTADDMINIIDMYNQICNFYDSSDYRVLFSDTMILVTESEYTKYVTDEIHDVEDCKVEYAF